MVTQVVELCLPLAQLERRTEEFLVPLGETFYLVAKRAVQVHRFRRDAEAYHVVPCLLVDRGEVPEDGICLLELGVDDPLDVVLVSYRAAKEFAAVTLQPLTVFPVLCRQNSLVPDVARDVCVTLVHIHLQRERVQVSLDLSDHLLHRERWVRLVVEEEGVVIQIRENPTVVSLCYFELLLQDSVGDQCVEETAERVALPHTLLRGDGRAIR